MNPLRWRKMSWAIVAWSVVMLIWIIAAANDRPSKDCKADAILSKQDCIAASDAGTAIGAGIVVFIWFLGFVVLGIIWLATRPRRCARCGERMRDRQVACKHCGYDVAAPTTP
jgi:hypothetical protein